MVQMCGVTVVSVTFHCWVSGLDCVSRGVPNTARYSYCVVLLQLADVETVVMVEHHSLTVASVAYTYLTVLETYYTTTIDGKRVQCCHC